MTKNILVVDDDDDSVRFFDAVLREEGYRVEEAGPGKEGLAKYLSGREFDLVITDLRMPGLAGLDLLREGKKEKPSACWVVITAFGSISGAPWRR